MVREYKLDQTFVHTTKTHEYRIRWTRLGPATLPPVVFVHGTPWSSFVWQTLATSLSTRYSIYLYDHPGFGSSPPHRRLSGALGGIETELDASLNLRAEASAALFRHWGLASPPHVVAHDNGGLVSLRLLLQHELNFTSLCLIDVVAIGPFGLPFFKLVAENERVFTAIPPMLIEGLVRAYIGSATHKSLPNRIADELSAPWLPNGDQGCERFLKEMIQASYRNASDVENEYGRVRDRSPTKIIWGKEDAWLPVETAGRLQEALQAEEIVVVEEAGHLIQYDQPSRLALEVGLWLGKHSKT